MGEEQAVARRRVVIVNAYGLHMRPAGKFTTLANSFRSEIQVEGFAEFFIAGWSKHDKTVWGMFVKGAPTLGELGAYDQFGTIVIRLIR